MLPRSRHYLKCCGKPWLIVAETLSTQAVKAKTIVGVIGNTGCGKSSIINAILDEERRKSSGCLFPPHCSFVNRTSLPKAPLSIAGMPQLHPGAVRLIPNLPIVVPTNCMRACTAVVTEISYNEGNEQPYRAQIEFVELDEWKLELETLFRDIVDRAGNVSKESSKEDSGNSFRAIPFRVLSKLKDISRELDAQSDRS